MWMEDSIVDVQGIVEKAALSDNKKTQLAQVLEDFSHLFDGKLGQTSLVEHSVDTGLSSPYHASPKRRQIIKEHIDEMFNIIEPASGLWALPLVIVEAPAKDPRFCIDFCKVTTKDAYTHQWVDDSLDFLARGKYISTQEPWTLGSTHELNPESRPKTASITHKGF